MYKGIKKLAELILESEKKFLTGQDEQEIYLSSLLKTGAQDEIWVSEDGEYHTVMIGNREEQDNSMQVCHESEHPVCLPKLLWIANALQKLLEQANGNLPIEEDENPELIRYAADSTQMAFLMTSAAQRKSVRKTDGTSRSTAVILI